MSRRDGRPMQPGPVRTGVDLSGLGIAPRAQRAGSGLEQAAGKARGRHAALRWQQAGASDGHLGEQNSRHDRHFTGRDIAATRQQEIWVTLRVAGLGAVGQAGGRHPIRRIMPGGHVAPPCRSANKKSAAQAAGQEL